MPRFFVKNEQIKQEIVYIIGEDVKHIKNVLRKQIGDNLEICNQETGKTYICEILELKEQEIINNIVEETYEQKDQIKVDIYQGLPKADKMELIIQKGTELGISSFIPVKLSRCIVKLDGKDEVKKQDRWQKISEVAAKQSGRDIVPEVMHLKTLNETINMISEYDLFLVAFEEEKENTLKNELLKLKELKNEYKIACLVGPEGGLTKDEVLKLEENGAKVITLGNRILRTETVAMYIASTVMYELEMN